MCLCLGQHFGAGIYTHHCSPWETLSQGQGLFSSTTPQVGHAAVRQVWDHRLEIQGRLLTGGAKLVILIWIPSHTQKVA